MFEGLVLAQALVDRPLPWLAWVLWLLVGFAGVFPGIVAYMVWAERKVAARFQDRIGPNRVGPLGLLQPIADAIKLITKEDIVPRAADRVVHILATVLLLISAMLGLAVVPFGFGWLVNRPDPRTGEWVLAPSGLVPVDVPSGLLYLIAVSSLAALGIFLAGWSSRNKYALLGAMRSVAQLISYEVPQVLSTVPVLLWAGSLSLVSIVNAQLDGGWFLFSPPGLVAFVTLLISGVAEVNRTPFDLPEAESEIIAGFHTEYSSMRFGLFFLAEYMSVFAVSCLAAVLFLGGGSLPFTDFPRDLMTASNKPASVLLVNAITAGVFVLKVVFFIFVFFWVRATLPRMRVDRLMNFAWKFLVPLSILNIPIAAVWFEMVVRPAHSHWLFFDLTWLAGVAVTAVLVVLAIGLCRWLLRTDAEATAPRLGRPKPLPALAPAGARPVAAAR